MSFSYDKKLKNSDTVQKSMYSLFRYESIQK